MINYDRKTRLRFKYYSNCVEWNRSKVHELEAMIDKAVEVKRQTVLSAIGSQLLEELAVKLGYAKHHSQGLTMNQDYHVEYYKSVLAGRVVYFVRQSAIEHVFVQRGSV